MVTGDTGDTGAATGISRPVGTRTLAVGMVLATSMNALEAVSVVTALPAVADDLGGAALYGAAFSAYMLANLVSIVITGELADRRGPALPFVIGLATFAVGLALAGVAPAMWVVVAARALQGFGGGAVYGCTFVAVGRGFPPERRPTLFAALSTAWVVPALLGPLLAGIVTEQASWRWVFLGMLPLIPAVGLLAVPSLRRIPAGTVEAGTRSRAPAAFALAAGVGLVAVAAPADDPRLAVAGVVAGGIVAARPFLRLFPPGTLRATPGLASAVTSRLAANAAFFGVEASIPLAVDRLHGGSAVAGGSMLIGGSCAWTVASWAHARRGHTWDPGRTVRVGFVAIALGVVGAMVVLVPSLPFGLVFVTWMPAGFGIGLVFIAISVVALEHAPEGREGLAGSQLQIADALGFALAGAVIGALLAGADRSGATEQAPLAIGFALAAAVAVVGALKVAPRVVHGHRR